MISRLPRRTATWAAVYKAAHWLVTEGRERLTRLSAAERREFVDLMRKSRGRPSNLSKREKRRISDFVKRAARGESEARRAGAGRR